MKSKQQTTEKPTDHRRNKKGNQNMHETNENMTTQNLWDLVKTAKGNGYSNTSFPQETREKSNN